MIPARQKVNKALFKTLMEKGRSYHSGGFSIRVFFAPNGKGAKFSVVVPKKLEKSAVKRNAAKRRVYDAARPFLKIAAPGSVSAIFIKKPPTAASLPEFTREFELIFKKAGVI